MIFSPNILNKGGRVGFSLVEVVLATGVFAAAIVAVIGLMAPLSRSVEDIIDSETAARLAKTLDDELRRIGFSQVGSLPTTFRLVATSGGERVLLLDGSAPADNPLDDQTMPGIADRDRYFLITMTQQGTYDSDDSGSRAYRALVVWPFMRPVGPPTPGASDHGDDPAQEVPPSERQSLTFFFAIRP